MSFLFLFIFIRLPTQIQFLFIGKLIPESAIIEIKENIISKKVFFLGKLRIKKQRRESLFQITDMNLFF